MKAKSASGKKSGGATGGKKKPKKKSSPATPSQSADHNEATVGNVMQSPKDFFQPIGLYEYLGLAMLAIYVVNFAWGSVRNAGVANKASEVLKPLLEEQFEAVGSAAANRAAAALTPSNAALPPVSAADAEPLERDSPACYKLYASGRRHVESALLTLDLQPRQDLWGLMLSLLDLATSRDTLTIELPFDDDSLAPLVFAVLRKKFAKKLMKAENMADLEGIPTSNSAASAAASSSGGAGKKLSSDKYTVLSELGPEIESELLSDRVVKLLSKPAVESLFLSLHVSDQASTAFSLSRKVLRARFMLPSSFDSSAAEEDSPAAAFQALLRLVFQLVDRLAELKLSPALKVRSEARRKKLAEALAKSTAKERAEAQFLRKQEQKRKEAEIIASDPTSEVARELIRKREAKEAKLQKKMKGSNVKVMR